MFVEGTKDSDAVVQVALEVETVHLSLADGLHIVFQRFAGNAYFCGSLVQGESSCNSASSLIKNSYSVVVKAPSAYQLQNVLDCALGRLSDDIEPQWFRLLRHLFALYDFQSLLQGVVFGLSSLNGLSAYCRDISLTSLLK